MGNGSGLIGRPLMAIDIETAAIQSAQNHGKPSFLMIPLTQFYDVHPEFHGTPWAGTYRMTLRERKVASLHTILAKLGIMDKMNADDFDTLCWYSRKRLKRAKWARYGKLK